MIDEVWGLVFVLVTKWASGRKEFDFIKVDGILHILGASLLCGASKVSMRVIWLPPPLGELKFNVNGVAWGSRCTQILAGLYVIGKVWSCCCVPSVSDAWSLKRQRCWQFFRACLFSLK